MADPVTVAAAVGWGMKAAGWVVSPIISNLVKEGFSYLGFDTSEKLRQLEMKVLQLELMLGLEAVQIYPHRNRLEPLLKNLQSAFYEAEDILDDVEYHRLERQVQSHPSNNKRWVHKIHSSLPSFSFIKRQGSGNITSEAPPGISKNRLKKTLQKIENIINEAHNIFPLLNLPNHSNVENRRSVDANAHSPVTTSAPPPVVMGRDEDRDKIISMLHENVDGVRSTPNGSLSHSLIGIHGIPGSGKSTLAQLVCSWEKKDKQEKKDGHFDLIMWVHVSQNFSVHKIFSQMLEEATGKNCLEYKNLNTLEQKLEEALSGKRFFLVLDDVWYNRGESQQELRKIVYPLMIGKSGSKILVTSRTADTLSALGAGRCISISDMDDNVFLKLFMHYALEGVSVDETNRSKFERIGADIAKKLGRSPLAASLVGGQLRMTPTVEFWMNARDRDYMNETMGALWWSYQQLDKQVRRCFSYCSILPRSEFRRDELVELWLAQGFIRTTDTGEDLEVVGHRYFQELVSGSFFKEHRGWFGETGYFTVHDLLHDLAKKVGGSDYVRIKQGWTGDLPQDVRHVFIEAYDKTWMPKRISQMESLRTLIIATDSTDETVFESIFTGMLKLRVLIVKRKLFLEKRRHLMLLPKSMGKLKHLRYFDYASNDCNKIHLPSTITMLYHLQVLDFGALSRLEFPSDEDMSKLINLRSVRARPFYNWGIRHLGWLTSLQTVPLARVKKEVGYEIQQLKHLNKIRGRLWIDGLESVGSKEAAVEANLCAKVHLKQLGLFWGYESRNLPDVEAEVLEGLCPPVDLETLKINGYHGTRYPTWMVGQQNGPEDLQVLALDGCSRMERIPGDSKLFTHLRVLKIRFCSWGSLPDNMERLMSLEELHLWRCREITTLPTLPQSLKEISVYQCSDVLHSSCLTIGHPNWQKIEHIPHKDISPAKTLEVPGTDHGVSASHLDIGTQPEEDVN
ncbi:putative disease resistance protein RGA3 [Oryza brachyantha]|uniref:Uncharacterized protein n=1 Tax=Oryza brachyantha TaxID=4533 RepID=J3NA81_ORYBR|nr:putative disease resistance protein RGA3 [Oryza brachyantha]